MLYSLYPIWMTFLAIITYFIAYFSYGFDASKFGADLAALVSMSFMSVVTLPAAIDAVKAGIRTGSDRLIFSYWLIWTFALIQRIWIIYLAIMERPTWLIESWGSGLIAIMFAIAGGYGMLAPVTGPEKIHNTQIIWMVIAGIVAGIVMGSAVTVYLLAGWVN